MKIRISSLADGYNHWTEKVEPGEIGLDTSCFTQEIEVEFELEKRSGKIPVTINVKADGTFPCDRCGEEFQRSITGNCSVMFIQRENPLPDEMPGDELRSFSPGQIELDVTTEVRDAIALSMPYKLLCSEDCKGLCPECGVSLNIESCTCKT